MLAEKGKLARCAVFRPKGVSFRVANGIAVVHPFVAVVHFHLPLPEVSVVRVQAEALLGSFGSTADETEVFAPFCPVVQAKIK